MKFCLYKKVGAVSRYRRKSSHQLLLAAVTGFKGAQAQLYAALDRLVQADFKVQKGYVLCLAPVAAVQACITAQVPGSGQQLTVAVVGQNKLQAIA